MEPLDGGRILVANEPRTYREALTLAVRAERPLLDVRAVDPADLDREVARCRPALVVCSELSPTVELRSAIWVLLYPEGARLAVVGDGEAPAVTGDLDLPGILDLVDRAVRRLPSLVTAAW
ncbi:MAG TPA: hypothetical protein VKB09_07525 [Thermomicrobiales bacterium]|nr:hypothetical protein [Thermomicrobiales bacterium]